MMIAKLAALATAAFVATAFAAPLIADAATQDATTARKAEAPQLDTFRSRTLDAGSVRVQSLRDTPFVTNRSTPLVSRVR